MNENVHTLRLFNYLSAGEGWGRLAGSKARQKLAQSIGAQRSTGVFRISLQSVRRLDVAFASEALVGLIKDSGGIKPICLVDLADHDIRENIAAAAERMKVPLTVWNGAQAEVLGPAPSLGTRDALAFALARAQVRAAEFAQVAGISTANASTKFRQLWDEGFLIRSDGTSPSGGAEYLYRRIG